jgi:predicted alpha/beta superfamily hydrolase
MARLSRTSAAGIASLPETSLRTTLRRVFSRENRRVTPRPGRRETFDDLGRLITVYLPPGYDEGSEVRYPVLYMQDGQNLFDPQRSYIPGQHWQLQEAADAAIGERTAAPMIIVGIDHAGPARIDEYTPTRDPKHNGGGRAAEYAKFLIEKVKPEIDRRYRTIPERAAVGGSSLGGLVSLYLVLKHPDVFKSAAVMSPSVWWNGRAILNEVDAYEGPAPRMWLDVGGREGAETLNDARALRDKLLRKGWTELRYFEDRRADHSERAWSRRVRQVLEFLFPPG